MKIVSFVAENLKRLKVVEITPSGNLVQITGANESGKTSVLDGIFWALAGTSNITSKPVREGERRAIVKLDMGEFVVTRRFTEAGGTSLTVEANGAEFKSPQRMLDELLGSLTFDPLAFSRMAPKAQLDTLKKLVKLDVDVDELDRQNAEDFAARTEINRTVKSLNEKANDLFVRTDPSITEAVDPDELLNELERAHQFNTNVRREEDSRLSRWKQVDAILEAAKTKREQAEMLLREADALEAQSKAEEAALKALPPIAELRDVSEIRSQIDDARRVNAAVAINNDYKTARAAENAARKAAEDLTDRMARRNEEKAAAIASAKMPIDGLSFGDGEVLYDGIPFDQASSAVQLRTSVAIAMAGNPKLRVMRIQDGSLLDEKSLAMLASMADDNDWQVWLEVVDTSGKVGIYMEDGAVAAIDGVPVAESQLTEATA